MKVFTNIVIFLLQALQPPISQQVWSTSLEFVFDKKKQTPFWGLGRFYSVTQKLNVVLHSEYAVAWPRSESTGVCSLTMHIYNTYI